MPRLTKSVPTYRKHKKSGQAVVTLDGRDVYLGPYGTAASRAEYDRLVAEYLAAGRRLLTPVSAPTVSEIVLAFWRHAEAYYRKPVLSPDGSHATGDDGKPLTTPTSELHCMKVALRPLRQLYGRTAAKDFSPLALKALRGHMIGLGWCRRSINSHVNRVKQVFKWAVENELVPAAVHYGLTAVPGLKAGRSSAVERPPVSEVPAPVVEATLPYLARHVRAMVELQLLTGMRPGEVCTMGTHEIDMSGSEWVYRPPQHKTSHHGHDRVVFIGPRAQQILRPFLKPGVCRTMRGRKCSS